MATRTVLFILPLVASATAFSQTDAPTLQVTDPAAIAALRTLNRHIDSLSKQVMVCVDKKLTAPQLCVCKYPAELAKVRSDYQAITRKYPSWSTRAVAWQDSSSGSPVGYTISIANLGPQLALCPAG